MSGESQIDELMCRRLRVSAEASDQQIRRAYHRLVHDVHPDTHPDDPGASRRLRELTEAYEVLIDPARQARRDRQPSAVRPRAGVGGVAPLMAGPVHVEPHPSRPGPFAGPPGGGADLSALLDAVFSPRWWW
jgi:DnaJ-class molecular chaperone